MHDARDNGRTRPDTIDNPQRRSLLARGTAALLAGAAIDTTARATPVASSGDDAELIELAGEFWRLDAIMDDWNNDRVPEKVGEDAQDDQWECLAAIGAIPATTLEGVRVKAECILHNLEACPSSGAEDHARAFLADLAGRAMA